MKTFIDTTSWQEYSVQELFGKTLNGKYHSPNILYEDENGYPYICASKDNNGINKKMPRVNGNEIVLTPPNIIAWGKQCPYFFYHNEPCVTAQGMYFLNMTDYSKYACLFICGILTNQCDGRYDYTDNLIGTVMDRIKIKLPSSNNKPDWNYMENFMINLENKAKKRIEEINYILT